jgi:hypothetical protein
MPTQSRINKCSRCLRTSVRDVPGLNTGERTVCEANRVRESLETHDFACARVVIATPATITAAPAHVSIW